MPGYGLPDPYVPQVAVPNFANTLYAVSRAADSDADFAMKARNIQAQNAMSDYLRNGGTPDGVANEMYRLGFGDQAQAFQAKDQMTQRNALAIQSDKVGLMKVTQDANAHILGSVYDEQSKQKAMDNIEQITGVPVPQSWRDMPWQQVRQHAGDTQMGPYQAAKLPLELAQQGATLAHTQAETTRANNINQDWDQNTGIRQDERAAHAGLLKAKTDLLNSKFGQEYSDIQIHSGDPYGLKPAYATGVHRQTGKPTVLPLDDPQGVLSGGMGGNPAPGTSTPGQPGGQGNGAALLQQAKAAVAQGADKAAVWQRLKQQGLSDQDIWNGGL